MEDFTFEDLELIEDMYYKAKKASLGEGDYIDPLAEKKAKTLEKIIRLVRREDSTDDEFTNEEVFIYKTKDRREFEIALNAPRLLITLYDIMCWNREIYNGKDYGEGSVIYREKEISEEEWQRLTNSFNPDRDIEYDWESKVYIDYQGEYPASKVFHVYTRDQINNKLDSLLDRVYDFVVRVME